MANAFGDEITTMRGNTIRSVCELFGVGSPTFYNNFRAKDAPSKFLRIISDLFQWINPAIETSLKEGGLDRVEYEILRAEKLL